jgi:multiple sugar transport system substrate-binding protein
MLADTPETARQRLFGGQVAMAICWPHQAPPGAESIPLAEGVRVAFAPLPGATEAYDFGERQWTDRDADRATCVPLTGIAGKLGSVTHNARRPLEAAGILALLTGEEWSETLSPVSPDTTLFRTSHLANPTIWTDKFLSQEASDNYAQAASATQELPVHVSSLRIPGFRRYLEVLDRAVQAAVAGNASPQEALTAAAGSWDEITDQLGRDSQSRAYARSLGLEP